MNRIGLKDIHQKKIIFEDLKEISFENKKTFIEWIKSTKPTVENLKFDKPTIFFSQKGKWNIETDNSSIELDYKDTFSVPVGSNISIKIEEKNESLLNCVSQI